MSKFKSMDEPEIDPVPSQVGEIYDMEKDVHHDAVFGDNTEDGPNYRNVRISHMILLGCADLF